MSEPQFPDARTVMLNNVRLSFTDTLIRPGKPKGVADAKESFGCNIIVEHDKPEWKENDEKIRSALAEAGKQFKGDPELYVAIAKRDIKRLAYRKGENFMNEKGEVYQGYEGHHAISAKGPSAGERRPKLMDRYKREVTDIGDIGTVFYSGCYADVILSFYATDKGGLGIFCSIEGIRSRQDGERMAGGGVEVTGDMFGDLPDDGDPFGTSGSSGSSAASTNDIGI